MEPATMPPQPKRRWYRKRTLVYLLILLLGCVAAHFAWDALFMPADLRRMQGTWKVVKVLTNDNQRFNIGKDIDVVIAGRYLTVNFPQRAPIEIHDGHF